MPQHADARMGEHWRKLFSVSRYETSRNQEGAIAMCRGSQPRLQGVVQALPRSTAANKQCGQSALAVPRSTIRVIDFLVEPVLMSPQFSRWKTSLKERACYKIRRA